jgi:hypothetical protein
MLAEPIEALPRTSKGTFQAGTPRRYEPTGRRRTLAQANAIQDALLADAINASLKPADRAQAARAWQVIEDQKRVAMCIGAPKPVEPRRKASKPRASAPVEQTEPKGISLAEPTVTAPSTAGERIAGGKDE